MELKAVERTCSDVETEDTTMIDGTTKVKHHRLKDRLSKDANFRMKCIIWICLCWSFIVLVSFFLFWFFVVLVIKNYMLVLCCSHLLLSGFAFNKLVRNIVELLCPWRSTIDQSIEMDIKSSISHTDTLPLKQKT